MPTIYVIAGPNGVGKTTFADRYLPQTIRELEFVNADLIARGLSPYAPDAAAMEAGRIALGRIRDLIRERRSFTWETTMSGKTAVGWLRAAKESGQTTLDRIEQRVIEGGHNIDPVVSRRRFYNTIRNFFLIYKSLFDSWKLIANDALSPRLLAVEKAGKLTVRDRTAFNRISREAAIDYET